MPTEPEYLLVVVTLTKTPLDGTGNDGFVTCGVVVTGIVVLTVAFVTVTVDTGTVIAGVGVTAGGGACPCCMKIYAPPITARIMKAITAMSFTDIARGAGAGGGDPPAGGAAGGAAPGIIGASGVVAKGVADGVRTGHLTSPGCTLLSSGVAAGADGGVAACPEG